MEKVIAFVQNNPKKTALIGSLAVLLSFLRFKQSSLLYHPIMGFGRYPRNNPYPYRNPLEQGLQYEDIVIDSKDGKKLRGWYMKGTEQRAKNIVLYYHENAGNIGTRLPYIKQIIKRTQSNVILVAYRGYSESEGSPSEKGIKLDSEAILEWALAKGEEQKLPLIVLGRSLGGAAALHACVKNQQRIRGIVLENTFTSIRDVAMNFFPLFLRPFAFVISFIVLTNKWKSINLIKNIRVPVLFIKSAKDELIPIKQMNQLSSKCEARHYEYVIKDGSHNETWILNPEQYFEQVNEFLSKL